MMIYATVNAFILKTILTQNHLKPILHFIMGLFVRYGNQIHKKLTETPNISSQKTPNTISTRYISSELALSLLRQK